MTTRGPGLRVGAGDVRSVITHSKPGAVPFGLLGLGALRTVYP